MTQTWYQALLGIRDQRRRAWDRGYRTLSRAMAIRFALLFLLFAAVYAEEEKEEEQGTMAEATTTEDNELEDPWELDLLTLIDSKTKNDDDENEKAPRYMTRLFRALTNPLDVGDGKGNLKRNLPHICYLGHGPCLVLEKLAFI